MYADNPLGRYLKSIVPNHHKALYDASCLSAIITLRLDSGWIKEIERVIVAGPAQRYAWTKTDDPNAMRVIRQIDQRAMQLDLFNTMKGHPTPLIGVAPK